jgi:hypothetical protein
MIPSICALPNWALDRLRSDPAAHPLNWEFDNRGLSARDRSKLNGLKRQAATIFREWDLDALPQIREQLEQIGAGPPEKVQESLRKMREVYVILADRHQLSEPMWRRLIEDLDNQFQWYRSEVQRGIVKGLLNGRISADRGLELFLIVDDQFQEGLIPLGEFRDFVRALDTALEREQHPLKAVS